MAKFIFLRIGVLVCPLLLFSQSHMVNPPAPAIPSCAAASVFFAGASGVVSCDGRIVWTTATSRFDLYRTSADNFGPTITFRKRGTTGDATAAILAGNEIGAYDFTGWDGAQYGSGASFIGVAKENFSPAAWGGRFTVFTSTTGQSGPSASVARLTIEDTSVTLQPPLVLTDSGTKPLCDAGRRFMIWVDAGASLAADTVEICTKDASDVYAWRSMI